MSGMFRVLVLAAVALALPSVVRAEPVTVFAAASLTDALGEIGELYREKTGGAVRFSFASSSTLARQIEAGAPADIFASANQAWMDYLAERHLLQEGTRKTPIGNRLVLIAPSTSQFQPVAITRDLDLAGLLGPDNRLAVGDPEHVPAGIYAREALTALGLWAAIEPRLARADNVRAALALVETGEAPLGIVYATDVAVTDRVKVLATFPEDSHPPITYPFAIVAGSDRPEVRKLFDFMTGTEGLAIFARHGFATD